MSEFYITTDQAEDGAWPEGMVKWNVNHVDVVHKDRSSMYPDFKKTIFIGGSRNSKENIRAWKDILNNHYGIAKSDKDFMDIFWYEYIEKEMFKRKEEKSMKNAMDKLGEWTFGGDTFVTGRTAVFIFRAKIPTTVYACKSVLRFAFHPVENTSLIVDVPSKDCDFGDGRGDLRDSFFVKVHTDTSHKLAIYDNYPNNLALKKIGEAYEKWLREEDEPMKNLQYFNRRFIKNVIFHDPATIVEWKDGSKTVVKTQDGEHYDPEKGLAMAISKKAMGNKRDYYHVFKHYLKKVETESVFGKDVKVLVIPASIEKDVIEFLQWKDKERIDAEFAKSQAEKEDE